MAGPPRIEFVQEMKSLIGGNKNAEAVSRVQVSEKLSRTEVVRRSEGRGKTARRQVVLACRPCGYTMKSREETRDSKT